MKPKFHKLLGLTTVIASFTPTATLMALDYTWTGTTSDVSNVATNWNPNGVPGGADSIVIATSTPNPTTAPSGNWERKGAGTTTISDTGILNVTAGDARLLNNGTFNLLGGTMNHSGQYFIVGSGGPGTFTQSGGAYNGTLRRGFFLSDGDGDSGSVYNLTNGTLSVKSTTDNATEELRGIWLGKGRNGNGTDKFNITGGTATFEKTGTLSSHVELSGNSELNITTGTVTFDKYTEAKIGYLASNGDRQAKITVNSGTLNFSNATGGTNVRIGHNDKGLLKINGGVVNIKGLLGIGTIGNIVDNVIVDSGEGICEMSGTAEMNITGNMTIGTGTSKGILTMTGGILTVTNAASDTIGGGNNGNATVTLSGTSVLKAENTKWKSGDYGGNANAGSTTISLSDTAALTLKEFTIGHLGGPTATETVTVAGNSSLTVNNFITIGRDDNNATSSIVSSLNLNGGTLSTKYIVKGADFSDVSKNFVSADGGTIKALASEPDFFKIGTYNSGRVYVNLQAGGLKFDTNGFNVGLQTGLHGIGGLTKTGLGTLSLASSSDYTGTTNVNTGALVVSTGNNEGNDGAPFNFADGTTLGVKGDSYYSWKTSNLTLGSSTGATLEIHNLDPFSGTTAINVTGDLVTHGDVAVKIVGIPTVGTFPLITYAGTISDATYKSFKLAQLPRGVTASLAHSNKVISLNISAVNLFRWQGNLNSTWDINTTSNWTLGNPSSIYLDNDHVRFDDMAGGTTAVALNTTVAPANVIFENDSKDYSIGGTGSITGATALSKTGNASLTLATTNTYTGTTTTNGGTLRFGDGITDGSITGPLVISDTNLIFNTIGTATMPGSIDGTFGVNNYTKTGAGTQILTGLANNISGVFQVNQGTLQIGNGALNGSISSIAYEIAAGAQVRLNYGSAPLVATPMYAFNGAGTFALASTPSFNWGELSLTNNFTGTLKVEEGRVSTATGPVALGGASKIEILAGAQFLAYSSETPYTIPIEIAGGGWGEAGFPGGLRLAAANTATWSGDVKLTADSGIMAQRGATFTITGSISGNHQCEFYTGDNSAEDGKLVISPTAGQNSYASTKINGRAGGSTFAGNANAFSSGPLIVAGSMLKLNGFNFTFANLSGTGGKIGNYHEANPSVISVGGDDTSTTYTGVILDGGIAPLGITKTGTGTLTLSGANAYTGATTVSQGTLSITSPTLGDTSTVSVANGAHLDLATGTAADTVGVLILGGVTMAPGTYNASHPTFGSYFTGTGSIVIAGGYSSWATEMGLNASNNGATQDPDQDGLSNLMEFYLNGNPLASDGPSLLTHTQDANYLTLTFHRRDDANDGLSSQIAQFGSDLSGWKDAVIGKISSAADLNGVIVDITTNDSAPDTVVVRIPTTNAMGQKLFGRLKIVK